MFDNVGWGEFAVLAVFGLLIFGPERLPKIAAQAGRVVRQIREMANGVTADLRKELGPDFDLPSLDPRRFLDDDHRSPAVSRPARTLPAPFDPDAT